MQISENLPQFEDTSTLILVCAKQSCDIHHAADAEINTINEIRIDNPEYSDREGHFKKSTGGAGGQTIRSGAVYEDKDAAVKSEFYKELNSALDDLENDPDIKQVVLICSPQIKNELRDELPQSLVKKITLEISGNHVGKHPTKILERIQTSK